MAHDDIAAENYEDEPEIVPVYPTAPDAFGAPASDAIRMVSIRKKEGESLVKCHSFISVIAHSSIVLVVDIKLA